MPERSSINPLQLLRKKSSGSHHRQGEKGKSKHTTGHGSHDYRTTDTYSINVTTTTTTSVSNKRNSISSSLSLRSSHSNRRRASLPLPTRRPGLNHNGSSPSEPQPLNESRKSRLQRLKLRAPRLSAPASSRSIETTTIARLRIDSNQEHATTLKKPRLQSRIPTPLDLPDGNLYSHKVYQTEGRRSVLSSLGRRVTGLKRNLENRNRNSSMGIDGQLDNNYPDTQAGYYHPTSGYASLHVPSQIQVDNDKPLSNPDCVEPVTRTTKSRTMIPIPASASSPCFDKIEAGHKRHSFPSLVSHSGRRVESLVSSRALSSRLPREETTIGGAQVENDTQDLGSGDQEQNSMTRKVRLRAHATSSSQVLSQSSTEKGPRVSGTFASIRGQTDKMPGPINNVEPRRFYQTRRSSEVLKSSNNTNPVVPPIRVQPEDILSTPSYGRTNRTRTTISTRTQERSRHKTHTDRMIQQPTTRASFPNEPQIQDEDNTHPIHQVSQPQPIQYWLGRFVTLTNAFHYEDSFNQPDSATGVGMLSSYSHPLGSAEKNLANYRVRRAFMVLENACLTEEASRSLMAFQNEYLAVKGDRCMG